MDISEELVRWETEFKKGFSKPLILLSLAQKPTYPYQLTKTIVGDTRGKISIAGSNIYPILKKIEDDGLIEGRKDEESRKRVYNLTEEGKEFLELLKESMQEFMEVIQELIDRDQEV